MSLNLAALDDQLTNVRQLCRKAPLPTVRRAYTRMMREWCQQTQWLRLNLGGETLVDQRTYTLGTDDNLDIMGIRAMSVTVTNSDGTTTAFPVQASDSTLWNPNFPSQRPLRYCYLAEGGFALDPAPDQAYTLTMTLIVAPKESAAATAQVPTDPLIKYSNDFEAGALSYLLAMRGEPWFDLQQAMAYKKDFSSAIANGKTEAQRAYNTGSMRARPRPFGTWGI
jgi:hypothetical protein